MVAARYYLGAAILVASASAVAGWWWHALRTKQAAAHQAREAVAAGRYDDASAALAEWLAVAPDDPNAHLVDGRILIAQGAVVEAADALNRAVELGGLEPGPSLLRALIAAKIGRNSEALPALYRAFAEARTPDRQVDEALGKVYLESFDLKRAMFVLDRWAKDFPDDPKPHLWRAEVHARDGVDPARVVGDYQKALARDPKLVQAQLGLADAYYHLHRTDEAAKLYDAYLEAHPDDASAHFGAGRNLLDKGDGKGAIRHFTRASELDPDNAEPIKELAGAAQRRGDWPRALDLLDRATVLDPNDFSMRYHRGLVLAHLGRKKEAKAELAESCRLRNDFTRLKAAQERLVGRPHDHDSQLVIARWMFAHGREEEGARWAGLVLAERPNDPEASRLLANHHERRGEIGLANFHRLHAAPNPAR